VKNANGKDLQVQLITGETIPISQPKRKEFYGKIGGLLGGYVMMHLYHLLDFLVTVTETLSLCVLISCFLKKPRFHRGISFNYTCRHFIFGGIYSNTVFGYWRRENILGNGIRFFHDSMLL